MRAGSSDNISQDDQQKDAESDHRSLLATPALFRIRDVLQITSLSRPTLYRRVAARRLPPPTHLGGRACGWASAALKSWIENADGYRAPRVPGAGASRRRGRPRKYTF